MGRDEAAGPADAGQEDVLQFGPSRPRRRWLPVVLAGLLTVAGVTAAAFDSGDNPPAPPAPSPAASEAPYAASEPPGTLSASPPVVTDEGSRLLGVTEGWEVFARGDNEVVRIQLASGQVTRTPVPALRSTGPVSFVLGPDRAIIRPLDFVPGYVVPDGRPTQALSGVLSHGGLFPGPNPGQVWMDVDDDVEDAMALVDMDGNRTGVSIPVPVGGYVTPDGAGYLLVNATGGVYDARPDGLHRVTTGRVLAVGPTRWLTVDCDDQHRCTRVVVDQTSGRRFELAGHVGKSNVPQGKISPDGTTAAVFRAGPNRQTALHLVDLETGADHPLPVPISRRVFTSGSIAWSPDSRWLFLAAGKLHVFDAKTRRFDDLGLELPRISQVAVRPACH